MATSIRVVEEGGREHLVTTDRLVKMVLWVVRNATRLERSMKGQVVFDYAGSRVAVKQTEVGEA